MLLLLERKLIFFPTRAEEHWMAPPTLIHAEDVYFRSALGDTIHGWWCVPDGWSPEQGVLYYLHGNAGNLSHRGESVRRFHQKLKLAVLIIDYPGYGRSTGRPDEAGCYASADAGYEWLVNKQGIQAGQIIIYGGSLGGGVALELAQRCDHRALLLVATFTSIADMAAIRFPWLPARRFIRTRFENLEKIARCHRPVLIAHGTADRVIPFSHGERLYAAANEPKRFFTLRDYDHNHTPPPEYYDEVLRFLESPAGAGRTDWAPAARI